MFTNLKIITTTKIIKNSINVCEIFKIFMNFKIQDLQKYSGLFKKKCTFRNILEF